MNRRAVGLILLLASGCAQHREAVAPRTPVAVRDSAVSVQAPFVNVRIGRPTSTAQAHRDGDDDRDERGDDDDLADSED